MPEATLLLIHGGLGEPMDADRFWVRPGVVAGLRARGFAVAAPDRLSTVEGWHREVALPGFLAAVGDFVRPLWSGTG